MTMENEITKIIEREGVKFTNHPEDKGGPTKFGITQATLGKWRGGAVSADDVKELTEEEAREIYRSEYLAKSPFKVFPSPLSDFLIDWSVTSGVDDPTRAIQSMLNMFGAGLKVDGVFGGKTRQAVENFIINNSVIPTMNRLIDARALFYARIVERDPTQAKFIEGWLNRTFGFRRY